MTGCRGGFTVTHEPGWYKAPIAAGGGPAAARSTLSRAWPATRIVVESHLVPRRFVNDDAVATTTRAADTIETPLGTNECLRDTRTDGTTVSTFCRRILGRSATSRSAAAPGDTEG